MNSLFVAWQDPEDRRWLPVGKLTFDGARYQFTYTKGAKESPRFTPFGKMTKLDVVHESDELFPLFANRLLSESRPEYRDLLRCLNVPDDEADPMVLLGRTGGRRATDTLEVFPCPEPTDTGLYHVHFFAHGIRHLPGAARRIEELHPGDRLFVMRDVQNSRDPLALTLRTDDPCVLIGYCPRYLTADLLSLLEECGGDTVNVTVERVNREAPLQLRLLCGATSCWPAGFRPCGGPLYEPIVRTVAVSD